MPTLENVFKNIGDMINKQNKKIDGIFPAGEYYKAATENLVAYLDTLGYHVKDLEYSDGYFIFGKGTNSVVSFHIEETPDWRYGIWWEVGGIDYSHPRKSKKELLEKIEKRQGYITGQFFCQYEPEIDKFKPSRSYFVDTMTITIFEAPDEWTFHKEKEIINFIHNEPYLAWMRDYEGVDFNREYHSREEAKEEFDKYFTQKNKDKKNKTHLQLEWIMFLKKVFANQLDKIHVLDNGDCCHPRFELFLVWDDFSNEVFDDEDREDERASCYLENIPFEVFGLDSSKEEIENKDKEMDTVEIDGKEYYHWNYNLFSDWLEIVSANKYAQWEKKGYGLPTLTDFIEKIYPTLNLFE